MRPAWAQSPPDQDSTLTCGSSTATISELPSLDRDNPLSAPVVYGLHVSLCAEVASAPQRLCSRAVVSDFLLELVERIGMSVLAGPLTAVETENNQEQGCSGVILLHESHAAVHTYSRVQRVFLDVFSCRAFQETTVIRSLEDHFGPVTCHELHRQTRGHHWPPAVSKALTDWRSLRDPI